MGKRPDQKSGRRHRPAAEARRFTRAAAHGPPLANGGNGVNGAAPQRPAAPAAEADGRDAGGRFMKGNAGGPGNPHARAVAERRKALLAAVGPADVAAVAQKLLAMALGGDVAAAKVVL